jgi:hypothetical protein
MGISLSRARRPKTKVFMILDPRVGRLVITQCGCYRLSEKRALIFTDLPTLFLYTERGW